MKIFSRKSPKKKSKRFTENEDSAERLIDPGILRTTEWGQISHRRKYLKFQGPLVEH